MAKPANKSAAVKAYLEKNPDAATDDIVTALKAEGIEVDKNTIANTRFRMKKAGEQATVAAKKEATKTAPKSTTKKGNSPKSKGNKADQSGTKRTRISKPYPNDSFENSLELGAAIFKFSGDRIRRLTLCGKMERSPTSSITQTLITNSAKYGITKGAYNAELLELTSSGKLCVDSNATQKEKLEARFDLAFTRIAVFKFLYDQFAGKRLPAKDVIKDTLDEVQPPVPDAEQCIDLFIVNAKYVGLLQTIAGAETLVRIEEVADQLGPEEKARPPAFTGNGTTNITTRGGGTINWDSTCFYITPIGDPGSEARKHSDMFMQSLIEPAMKELELSVVRSDQIGEAGMITTLVLEHLRHAKLCIADLSMLNPNVFYETALRHTCRLPIVQLIRKSDKLPFDVNQVKSVTIDLSEMYSFVPQIQTYVSEIATMARKAIEDPSRVGNPISVFYPDFWK